MFGAVAEAGQREVAAHGQLYRRVGRRGALWARLPHNPANREIGVLRAEPPALLREGMAQLFPGDVQILG